MEEESDTRLCPSGDTLKLSLEGQLWHDAATMVFPAAPKGHVFWIRRVNTSRNMIEVSLCIMFFTVNPLSGIVNYARVARSADTESGKRCICTIANKMSLFASMHSSLSANSLKSGDS